MSAQRVGPAPVALTNVVLILADDLGFSDLGCYGGEIDTPNLDQLADQGARLTRFYNTARCSPSRASLLTGMHPHQTGIGILTQNDGPAGYLGTLNDRCRTAAEVLQPHGYTSHLSGKWHLASQRVTPDHGWPTRRGFDSFFGTLTGCGSYFTPGTLTRDESPAADAKSPDFYYTDAIGDDAARFVSQRTAGDPFFLYVAFTAPHWPLHAKPEDLKRYRGRYDVGWDVIRRDRLEKQRRVGVVDSDARLSPRDPLVPAWADTGDPDWQARRMEAYAAQVDCMDQNVGKILAALERHQFADDTLVIFLSDNGASYEELPLGGESFKKRTDIFPGVARGGEPIRLGNTPDIVPGPEDTYASYGRAWANASNTPYRLYKEYVHEGGIAAPFIVRWPNGPVAPGAVVTTALQLVDVLPTILDALDLPVPDGDDKTGVLPLAGRSFLSDLAGRPTDEAPLFWEHLGNAAIRRGAWKLVRQYGQPWELYDIRADPIEEADLSAAHPAVASDLAQQWELWAQQSGVRPWAQILAAYQQRGLTEDVARGS